jgi:hypothetical protein
MTVPKFNLLNLYEKPIFYFRAEMHLTPSVFSGQNFSLKLLVKESKAEIQRDSRSCLDQQTFYPKMPVNDPSFKSCESHSRFYILCRET